MAYDVESDRVILWGGEMAKFPPDASVWAYDFNSTAWQDMGANEGPSPRGHGALAYDVGSDQIIFVGGLWGGDETWAYDYNVNSWSRMTPDTIPGEVSRHALAYSGSQDQVILYGGGIGSGYVSEATSLFTLDPLAETWVYDYDSDSWIQVTGSHLE